MAKERNYRELLDHVRAFSSIARYGFMPGHLLAAHHDCDVQDCLARGLIEKVSKPMAGGLMVDGVVLTERGAQKACE